MIRQHRVIKKAICDVCGAKLSSECQENDDGTVRGVHFGRLENHCGYGSDIDAIDDRTGSLDLCEACYLKALAALGIPREHYLPEHLRLGSSMRLIDTDEEFNGELNREVYPQHLWTCKYCDWFLLGKGMALPDHLCDTVKEMEAKSKELCNLCRGEDVGDFRTDAQYSQREETWVHWKKGNSSEVMICGGRELRAEVKNRRNEK
jgi:hypothetical protein